MKYLFALLSISILASCSKSTVTLPEDKEGPMITLLSPLGTPGYTVGEPVCFAANVMDESTLQLITLSVRKNGTELPAYTQRFRPAEKVYAVNTKIFPGMDCAGNSMLLFETMDRLGNKRSLSIPLDIR